MNTLDYDSSDIIGWSGVGDELFSFHGYLFIFYNSTNIVLPFKFPWNDHSLSGCQYFETAPSSSSSQEPVPDYWEICMLT